MKKFLVVILSLVYFATSTGATFSMHYCMGKLADWELGQNKSKTCGFCGMDKGDEKDNGCCKDEQKFIKNDTDQKTVQSSTYTLKFPVVAELPDYFRTTFHQSVSFNVYTPLSHAPPRCKDLPIYISKRSFLI
jgi:hypothetical protein